MKWSNILHDTFATTHLPVVQLNWRNHYRYKLCLFVSLQAEWSINSHHPPIMERPSLANERGYRCHALGTVHQLLFPNTGMHYDGILHELVLLCYLSHPKRPSGSKTFTPQQTHKAPSDGSNYNKLRSLVSPYPIFTGTWPTWRLQVTTNRTFAGTWTLRPWQARCIFRIHQSAARLTLILIHRLTSDLATELVSCTQRTMDAIAALAAGPMESLTWDVVMQPIGTQIRLCHWFISISWACVDGVVFAKCILRLWLSWWWDPNANAGHKLPVSPTRFAWQGNAFLCLGSQCKAISIRW